MSMNATTRRVNIGLHTKLNLGVLHCIAHEILTILKGRSNSQDMLSDAHEWDVSRKKTHFQRPVKF